MSAHRPSDDSMNTSGAAQRSTLCIRNIRQSVVYHLLFDGDVGRLTGAQLKAHVQSICSMPAEQQLLTFNGQAVHNSSTGYDLNLRDGSMLVLDSVNRGGGGDVAAGAGSGSGAVRGASAAATPLVDRTFDDEPAAHTAAPTPPPPPQAAQETRTLHAAHNRAAPSTSAPRGAGVDYEAARRREDEFLLRRFERERERDRGTVAFVGSRDASQPTFGAVGLTDEIDVDVEVVEEPGKLTWQPTNSADVEESRMLQQDYVWRMEQVRFETERMNREREMRRQQQELEYQAELLDRERITLERRTQAERLKFSLLQQQRNEDMAVQARASAMQADLTMNNSYY